MKKKFIKFVMVSVLNAVVCMPNLSAKNHVQNPGFENGADFPDGWTLVEKNRDAFTWEKDSGVDGGACISTTDNVQKRCHVQSKGFKLVEGVSYTLSASFKTESYSGNARLVVLNSGWTWYKQIQVPQGDNDWTAQEIEFTAGSSPNGLFYIYFYLEQASGLAMVDDIAIAAVDGNAEKAALKAMGPENSFPGGSFETGNIPFSKWPKNSPLIIELSEENPHAGSKCLHLKNESGNAADFYTYVPIEPEKEYVLETAVNIAAAPQSGEMKVTLNFNKEGGGNGSAGRKVLKMALPKVTEKWLIIKEPFTSPADAVTIQLSIGFGSDAYDLCFDSMKVYKNPDAVKAHFSVFNAVSTIKVDGKLNEKTWSEAETLGPFFLNSSKSDAPKNDTIAQFSYDDKNLYLAVRAAIAAKADVKAVLKTRDDENIWKEDGIEFFIFPQAGTGYHFLVNAAGILLDYSITQSSFSDMSGLSENKVWNSAAKIKTTVSAKEFIIEMSIPLSEIGLDLKKPDKVLFNITRTDSKNSELGTFSKLTGRHLNPKMFSSLEKADDTTGDTIRIERFIGGKIKNFYSPQRNEKIFTALQSAKPAGISVSSWYQYGALNLFLKDNKTIPQAQASALEEENFKTLGQHGELGAFISTLLPNFKERGGTNTLSELNKKYGTRAMFYSESSAVTHRAIELLGGEIMDPRPTGASKRGSLSTIHPAYSQAALIETTNLYIKYKDVPWAYNLIYGRDEPNNNEEQYLSLTKNPKSVFIPAFAAKVKNNFGFGRYGLPDVNNPKTYDDPLSAELSFIAFARAWTAEFKKQRQAINRELKKINPKCRYMPMNLNFIEGVRFDDLSEYDSTMGDAVGCDPYASWIETEGRGMYNHGFATKLTHDLVAIHEVMTIIQAFAYKGYSPTLPDIKEWVSQALKMGADHIQYYDADKYITSAPDIYKGMMEMNGKITGLKKINIPQKAEVAVIHSLYSYLADGISSEVNESYTCYGLLGEVLHSWFKFVSDRDIEKGKADLKAYKLIFVPSLHFGTEKIFNDIIAALDSGAVVVFLDPRSFGYDIQGKSFASLRETILGVKTSAPNDQAEMTLTGYSGKFPLYKKRGHLGKTSGNSLAIITTKEVIGKYADGSPAVVKGIRGKGTFYYFAANPMNPEIFIDENNWKDFFAGILKQSSIPMNEKIWDFHIDGK